MRQLTRPSWSIQWQRAAAPRSLRLVQSAVMTAALAVVVQSVVNLAWGFPAWLLHTIFFCGLFPLVCFYRHRRGVSAELGQWPSRLALDEDGVYALDADGQGRIRLRVRTIAQAWGGLVVEFEAACSEFNESVYRKLRPILIWPSDVDFISYRKISVLLHWHARAGA